ncbi:MAG: hypothetical protein ACXVBE_07100, partial [Bdellovibrionota bacterium]
VASGGRINAYAALRMTLAKRDGNNSKILLALDKEDKAQDLAVATPPAKESAIIHRDVAFH